MCPQLTALCHTGKKLYAVRGTQGRSLAVADEPSNGKHTVQGYRLQNSQTSRRIVQQVAGEESNGVII